MKKGIKQYKEAVLALIFRKTDFDQIIYDIGVFAERIGYKTIVKKAGSEEEKRSAVILKEIQNITNEDLEQYFLSLVKKKDFWLFEPGNFKLFAEEMNELAVNTQFFSLTCAIELKNKDLRALSDKLSKKMGRNVIIDMKVDRSVLGGAIIKKDNYIFDFSVKTKLSKLSAEWKKAIHRV